MVRVCDTAKPEVSIKNVQHSAMILQSVAFLTSTLFGNTTVAYQLPAMYPLVASYEIHGRDMEW